MEVNKLDEMLKHNRHIVKYLNSYIKNENNKFAVMIDGEWGTGKSYFVEKYSETRKDSKSKIHKVSAFGLSQISELENLILDSISGETGVFKKAAKQIWANTRLGVNAGPFETNISGAEVMELYKKNLNTVVEENKNSLVIIDDFERTNINFGEMLGFCSRLIFENGLKVVFICNESKLEYGSNDEQKKIYFEFKEKVIGKTFTIFSDANTAFKVFTNELKNICEIDGNETKKLVFDSIDLINKRIQDTFVEQDYNLRVYQYALSDMMYFIEGIFKDTKIDDKFVMDNKEYFEKIIYLKLITYLSKNNFFYGPDSVDSKKMKMTGNNFITGFFNSLNMDYSRPLMEEWGIINTVGDFSKYPEVIKNEIQNKLSKSLAENSPMILIKNFLDNLYDLPQNEITDISDIKNKIMDEDFYDIGVIYHYLCIVAFLKKRGIVDVELRDEFNDIIGKTKEFETKENFYLETDGYFRYTFLSPDKQNVELIEIKKELILKNSANNQEQAKKRLNKCSTIEELTELINQLKTEDVSREINLSSIFDKNNSIFSPEVIVNQIISTDSMIGGAFIGELLKQKKNMKTNKLLENINNELLKQKIKNPKSYSVIKIDRIIADIGITDIEW